MHLSLDMSTTPQHTLIADRHRKVLSGKETQVLEFLRRYLGTSQGDPLYDLIFESIMRGTKRLHLGTTTIDPKRLDIIKKIVKKRWKLEIA